MKKISRILLIILILILPKSCAKPTVVDVVMPRDKELNCKELKDEYAETRRFRQEALEVQTAPGANTARATFFWPALLVTLHNGDKAINAANKRAYHVVNLMKKKNCEEADNLFREITKTSSASISIEIQNLNKLYKKGVLTKEEFEQAKKKILE
tara:strand:- start:4 stop:468 length:465 start_codon:yes stop_codon:yes gene_type:complete